MRKIKAISEIVNGIRFDSQLEAQAYRLLALEFGKSRISCHESISYTSNSRLLPELTHKVDFVIRDEYGYPVRYLEIKGNIEAQFQGKAEYLRTLMLLQTLRPNVFDKYILWVGGGELRFNKKMEHLPYALSFPSGYSSVKESLLLT